MMVRPLMALLVFLPGVLLGCQKPKEQTTDAATAHYTGNNMDSQEGNPDEFLLPAADIINRDGRSATASSFDLPFKVVNSTDGHCNLELSNGNDPINVCIPERSGDPIRVIAFKDEVVVVSSRAYCEGAIIVCFSRSGKHLFSVPDNNHAHALAIAFPSHRAVGVLCSQFRNIKGELEPRSILRVISLDKKREVNRYFVPSRKLDSVVVGSDEETVLIKFDNGKSVNVHLSWR